MKWMIWVFVSGLFSLMANDMVWNHMPIWLAVILFSLTLANGIIFYYSVLYAWKHLQHAWWYITKNTGFQS